MRASRTGRADGRRMSRVGDTVVGAILEDDLKVNCGRLRPDSTVAGLGAISI